MSNPSSASQAKRTGMAIISDPLQFKKPTMADMRAAEAPVAAPQFTRPKISDLRGESDDRADDFKRPKLNDLKDMQVNFTMEKKPEYKPYTVEEYREIQQMDQNLNDRGGLGPSLDEEWERKQQMRTRLMQFAKKTNEENRALVPKRTKPRQEPQKGPSKRDKMKEYASNIPKPKAQTKDKETKVVKEAKTVKPVAASYDLQAELQRHEHFVARVEMLKNSLRKFLI